LWQALEAEKRDSREVEARATKSTAELKDQISSLEARLHEEQVGAIDSIIDSL
jgi:hypothetical protein